MQHIPLSVRIKALFARDKGAFWWNHFTDEEKKLRRMDVWELAKVINEARVRNLAGEAEKLIVAEQMLNVRLAKIQATASWGSGVLGFVGAIIGAAISVALTMAFQSSKEVPCAPERLSEKQAVVVPAQESSKSVAQPLKNDPNNKVVEPRTGGAASGSSHDSDTMQTNAPAKP